MGGRRGRGWEQAGEWRKNKSKEKRGERERASQMHVNKYCVTGRLFAVECADERQSARVIGCGRAEEDARLTD